MTVIHASQFPKHLSQSKISSVYMGPYLPRPPFVPQKSPSSPMYSDLGVYDSRSQTLFAALRSLKGVLQEGINSLYLDDEIFMSRQLARSAEIEDATGRYLEASLYGKLKFSVPLWDEFRGVRLVCRIRECEDFGKRFADLGCLRKHLTRLKHTVSRAPVL